MYQKLKEYVVEKLKIGWSPEQINLRLVINYPRNKKMRIFHEAIYQYVYSQLHRNGNGTSKKGCEDLRICLLTKKTHKCGRVGYGIIEETHT